MLLKLIKHDFRALSRVLLPLNLSVVAAGVLEAILLTVMLRLNAAAETNAATFTASAAMTLPMTLIAIAVFATSTVTLIMIIVHFYRNLIGDEGYLMFTLPTTAGRILWSKLISGMLYLLINAVAIAMAVDLVILFGTSTEGVINTDVIPTIQQVIPMLKPYLADVNLPMVILPLSLFTVTGTASQLLKLYFSMAIGGLSAKKHKLLAAIGVYFGTNIVLGVAKNVLRALFALGAWGTGGADLSGVTAITSYLWYSVGTSLAACALFFLLSRMMFTKHLNLQ